MFLQEINSLVNIYLFINTLSVIRQSTDSSRKRLLVIGLSLVQTARVAWPNFEPLEVCTCGLWSVELEQSCRSYGAWLCKYLGSIRVNGCNGADWSFDVRAIYRYNAGNHRCTYKPTSHIDSSHSDDRK
ncbi:hypothetical protein AVEN_190209-1 [Araneus ventricosus]|uniref:Uncharacterized protein n=1 Tax=Araneus ventricosus TaxID=182803 RepID=A0A4Y2FC12_ARAVE|nr:hypothetical protein AVEN_190209-1 [Araneus ventricosus]